MTLPHLPDDVLANIIKRVGEDAHYRLTPFIKAGKRSLELVFREETLKSVNICDLCSDPANIMEGAPGYWPEGKGRAFMVKCLDKGNGVALYYEGLRIASEVGDLRLAKSLLRRNCRFTDTSTLNPYATLHTVSALACAMFFVLLGEPDESVPFFNYVFANHGQQGSFRLRCLGEELKHDIEAYNVSYLSTYENSFKYPECESVSVPDCVDDHDNDFFWACDECFLYWCARSLSYML